MSAFPLQIGNLFPFSGAGTAGFGSFGRGSKAKSGDSSADMIQSNGKVAQARPRAERRSLDQPSDEILLDAYLHGDRAAFTTLMGRYSNELLHFLTRFLGSRAAADDVFQETFLQIHLSAETFDPERRFKPWLFTIAANKARDYHRKHNRFNAMSLSASINAEGEGERFVDLLESDGPDPDVPLLDAERSRLVKRVMDAMPVHLREILLLSYFQRLSYNQIADSLEIPLGTVKSRLHTAVAAFAKSWKAERGSDLDNSDVPDEMPGSQQDLKNA